VLPVVPVPTTIYIHSGWTIQYDVLNPLYLLPYCYYYYYYYYYYYH